MRNLILFAILFCSTSTSFAQSAQVSKVLPTMEHHNKWSTHLKNILNNQVGTSSSKTTAAKQRLESFMILAYDGSGLLPYDSCKFFYSNGRGSTFNLNDMFFNYYDDYSAEVRFDSYHEYYDNNGSFTYLGKTSANYNSNNSMTRQLYENYDVNSSQLVNSSDIYWTYDANGNVAMEYFLSWNPNNSKWDTLGVKTFMYDIQNNLISDSAYGYTQSQPSTKTDYQYDINNNLTDVTYYTWNGTTWNATGRESNTYTGNNLLETNLYEMMVNGSWQNIYIDSFGYNGTNFYTYDLYKEWDTTSKAWVNSYLEERTLNAQSLPDSQKISSWDTTNKVWEKSADNVWQYNSDNNPTKLFTYVYILGVPLPNTFLDGTFYYESYFDVSVDELPNNIQATVYPNPASEILNIQLSDATPSSVISLANVAGQVVWQHKYFAGKKELVRAPISGLTPGTYILTVQGNDGSRQTQKVSIL